MTNVACGDRHGVARNSSGGGLARQDCVRVQILVTGRWEAALAKLSPERGGLIERRVADGDAAEARLECVEPAELGRCTEPQPFSADLKIGDCGDDNSHSAEFKVKQPQAASIDLRRSCPAGCKTQRAGIESYKPGHSIQPLEELLPGGAPGVDAAHHFDRDVGGIVVR